MSSLSRAELLTTLTAARTTTDAALVAKMSREDYVSALLNTQLTDPHARVAEARGLVRDGLGPSVAAWVSGTRYALVVARGTSYNVPPVSREEVKQDLEHIKKWGFV